MSAEEEVIIAISGWMAFKPLLWFLGALTLVGFITGIVVGLNS